MMWKKAKLTSKLQLRVLPYEICIIIYLALAITAHFGIKLYWPMHYAAGMMLMVVMVFALLCKQHKMKKRRIVILGIACIYALFCMEFNHQFNA